MKKQASLAFFTLLLLFGKVSAQTDSLSSKYLSIGSKQAGVCFGNSPIYTGLRINLLDKRAKVISGVNCAILLSRAKKNNGVSLGLLGCSDSISNGFSFGLLLNGGTTKNGLGVAGLFLAVPEVLNGFFVAGIGVVSPSNTWQIRQINGVAIAFGGTRAESIKGLTIGAINGSSEHNGLSIGLFNRTEKLRGVQLGLINYVGNNPKGLRWLPIMNLHYGKIR